MADDNPTPFLEDKSKDDPTQDETDKEEAPTEEVDKSIKGTIFKTIGHSTEKNPRYRRVMEDEHIILDPLLDINDTKYALLAVYDGHGGRNTVEFVSKNLHETLKEELKNGTQGTDALKNSFKKTDEQIAANKIQFSGCTAAAVLIIEKSGKKFLHSANVGDARAVLVRNGVSVRLTYDHKATDEGEVKRIVGTGGFVIMNRVNGMLAVTRSLGDITMKEFVISDAYTQEFELLPTDSHLIVACDGLWDVVSDQDAYNIIKNEKSAQKATEKLLQNALSNGSTDNISILVAFL